jgi:endonuclease/exonuclease/phosphatase family metal-dependent hydrolase
MDVLVARVDATRDEAARQAAIDAGGAARDAYRANDFCDAVPAPKTPHTLRVASLNLWQPAADTWPRRRAALARLLRDADVDVVALQEARGEPRWVDELREACAAEGLEFPHSRYVPGTGGGAGGAAPPGWAEEGVGVLSKFPLPRDDDALAPMPPAARSSDRNPRTALGVLAETPFGNLRVVAAHLSYDRRQQCDSVSTILRPWLDALWGREEALGQVLVGDLNTYPDYEWPLDALTLEPEILRLVGGPCAADAPLVLEGPPFVDAWARTRPLDSGATFPNPETMNLDVARPDRVLARGLGLRPRAAAVLGCDLVEGAKGHAPSDHRLLVVDLEVVAA